MPSVRFEVIKKKVLETQAIDYENGYKVLQEFKMKLAPDPVAEGLSSMNEKIAQIQELKSDLVRTHLLAIQNKDKWQRAYRAVLAEYNAELKKLLQTEEVKSCKSFDEKKAKADQNLSEELELIRHIEKHYFKDGASEHGGAVNFLAAVDVVKDELDSINFNIQKQMTVIDQMLSIREITEDTIKARKRARQQLVGGTHGISG